MNINSVNAGSKLASASGTVDYNTSVIQKIDDDNSTNVNSEVVAEVTATSEGMLESFSRSNESEREEENQEQKVIKAIEKANKHIKVYDRRLEFSIHDQTKQIMVKVINTEDDSTIREIPSEKILDLVAHLWEMAGIFVDEKR